MNKKLYIAFLTSLVLIAGGVRAFANHGGEGKMHGGMDLKGAFFQKAHCILNDSDKLGLSEDQVNSIRTLKMDTKKTVIRQGADVEIAKVDLHSALQQDNPDAAALQKLIDQKFESKKTMAVTVVNAYVKLKEILTPEQWQSLKTIEKEKKMKKFEQGGFGKKAPY